MQISNHVYSTHIREDPSTFGAMHPGGTQIYFVGDPKSQMIMVDSGEPYRSWTKQILEYHTELGRPSISAILITHGHGDHIGGLDRLQEAFDCPVRCHPKLEPRLTHQLGLGCVEKLSSREVVHTGAGASLRAYYTPGHEEDHIAYYMAADKAVFSGDTILGNSSSSVRNLTQYMKSLQVLARLKPTTLFPGHGQVIKNGTDRVQWYINHRQQREDQLVAAIENGASTVDEMVNAVYPRNLRKNLRGAAARNINTHLEKLREEGRVIEDSSTYAMSGYAMSGD